MRLVWRPLAPHETDHELLWLSVSLGGLVLAAAWLKAGLPWPVCWFHQLTGHPCATCGATRAALAFFRGDFLAAFAWNPLAFLAYCAIALFDAYAFLVLILRRPRLRILDIGSGARRLMRWSAIAALAMNWTYLLIANPSV